MRPLLADSVPVSDLLDVFSTYDGNVIFSGLTVGTGGQPSVLGMIGWIFTAFGALFVLWGRAALANTHPRPYLINLQGRDRQIAQPMI